MPLPRKLSPVALYATALGAVALLVIGGQTLLQRSLRQQEHDSRLVNVAGRQRMLSQKLAKAALAAAAGRVSAREELGKALDEWTRAHDVLRRGLPESGPPSAEVSRGFERLQPDYEVMVGATRDLLAAGPTDADASARAAQTLLAHENAFLGEMDDLVSQYGREAAARVANLRRTEAAWLALTLLVLALEGLFIFRPAAVRRTTLAALAHSELALRHAQAGLEARVAERTAELELVNARLRAEATERARAEAARQLSEGRLHALLQHAHDIMSIMGEDAVVRYASPATERLLGYAPEFLVGRSITEFLHPEDLAPALAALGHAAAGEAKITSEFRFRHAGGDWRFLEAVGSRAPADSPVEGIIVCARDVSARRQAEAALRDSEENYRSLFALNPQPTWVYDPATLAFLAVNQAAVEHFGYSREELLAMTVADVRPPGDVDRLKKHLASQTPGKAETKTWRHRRKDGTLITVESTCDQVFFAGRTTQLVVSNDVTRRDAQAAHLQTHARQQEAVARLGHRALETGEGGLAELLQEAAETVAATLGSDFSTVFEHLPAEGVLVRRAGHGWPREAFGEIRAGAEASVRSVAGYTLLTGQPVVRGDMRRETQFQLSAYSRQHGAVAVLSVIIARETSGATPFGVLSALFREPQTFSEEDLAFLRAVANILASAIARQRVEAAVQDARREAERANAAKSEFLSRMSHELRTPLNAILGFGQLLELDRLTVPQTESVGHILKAGRHLLSLINEVLDIARIESGRLELSIESLDVREVLGEAVTLIRPMADQRALRLETHLCHRGCHVLADPQRLRQVLLNLLSNAVKYNVRGGRVTLGCEPDGTGRVSLSVTDTGAGIAPEDLCRLFAPFERLGAGQRGIEGTGIGLAISKRLVEAMDGQLSVRTAPGQGTTFTVELPAGTCPEVDEMLGAVLEPTLAAPPTLETRTVLHIEDNATNLSLVERVLGRRPGLRLLSAQQGRLGLALAREHRPELILLDLDLPDLPGAEVLAQLRDGTRTRDIPVIILSADSAASHRDGLLAAGARAFLTKPFVIPEFLRAVDEAILSACPVI